MLSNDKIHDLAVAYAQAKLLKYQQDFPEKSGYSDEIRAFLESYYFAEIHLPEEDKEIDLSELV